ncbi:alpha/beta family hydrolase [Desulfospira joergensenii]|uniref:alpha/beta hydrolase family protein n=1 Tax=Desulfospira joergensenii TaxID=53329 RepID=UPI0003B43E34|nr:alpha/beta family hydrolase [Desulfospira joergensenii]
MDSEKISIDLDSGEKISGILSLAKEPDRGIGVVFAHGAANDMNHALLAAGAEGLSARGYSCLRFNFPYREKGKKSPDPEHRLIRAWCRAADFIRSRTHCNQLIAAGKSLGARMAAQASAQGLLQPDGLIFLGYPLHAPGRKEQLRDAPLKEIQVPMLFVEGTRDPFCDLDLLRPVLKDMSSSHTLEIIQGGDHSFKLPKSDPRTGQDIHESVILTCLTWIKKEFG